MSRNEKTSARVARIAAKVMALKFATGMNSFVQVVHARRGKVKIYDPDISWSDIRTLAASALTQTADKAPAGKVTAAQRAKVKKNQRHLVRVKAEGFDQVLVGPVELMKPPRGARPDYDDRGFDPRDGGKVGREFIPKSAQVRKALRGKLGSWPPSAKPVRRSP